VSHTDTEERVRVPTHHRLFVCALVLSTATLVVQLLHVTGGPAMEQAVVTTRVACTILWAWFFASYTLNVIGRRIEAAEEHITERLAVMEERLSALEAAEPRERASGLDTDAIESAKIIAMRLMRNDKR
jgi:hypothetical protein